MHRFCLTVARLAAAMWIGAAFLFVVTSVTEQVHASFDTATKDTLALIRFPWYYGTGRALLLVGMVSAAIAGKAGKAANPAVIASVLLLFANAVLWSDYVWVYRPLRELLLTPGSDRGPAFESLHHWSEVLNAGGFLLSATAAIVLCAARDRSAAATSPGGTATATR
jgi:hypothetical protein